MRYQQDCDFYDYYSSKINKLFRLIDIQKKILLKKYIKGYNNKILDFGCGTGSLTSFLSEKSEIHGLEKVLANNVVYGLDNDERLLKIAKENGLVPVKGDFTETPFKDEYFDYIISSDSIEHTTNRNETFLEIKRILKKDGIFLIFTPAYDSISWVIGEKIALLLTGRKYSGHISPFTFESLYYFLDKYFNEVRIKRINLGLGLFAICKNQ